MANRKEYGRNIDFNKYDLKPSGSYLDSSRCDLEELLGSMSVADEAAKKLLRETSNNPMLSNDAPKTCAEKGPETPDLNELLAELDSLIGLNRIKENVKSLINLNKVRKLREEHGLPVPPMSLHLVFIGNPGTGKTTVARLLAKLYHAIGVLSKGQLVEVDRSGLVAGFVGQTAIKTGEVIKSSLGGVLFIDEAYSLSPQDSLSDFGHEAIETLLKAMEDNRSDFVVIAAGYGDLMEGFISSNPGLESRFNRYFVFEDYCTEELFSIFSLMCNKNEYVLTPEAEDCAKIHLDRLYETRNENFGNARDVRNIFENVISVHSDRVSAIEAPTRDELMTVQREDIEKAALLG